MNANDLEARVRRLERQVTRQRRLLFVVLCALLVAGAGTSLRHVGAADDPIPDVVKARAFHVIAEKGGLAVEVGAIGETGSVVTYDGKERTQTALGTDDEGGGHITCFNKRGEIQINLGGDMDGGQIVTNGKTGIPRVLLSGDEDGGLVATFSPEGKLRKLQ